MFQLDSAMAHRLTKYTLNIGVGMYYVFIRDGPGYPVDLISGAEYCILPDIRQNKSLKI